MFRSFVLATVVFAIPLTADDGSSLEPIRFLIGNWQGKGEGLGGPSTVTHTIEPVLSGKFIRWRTRAVFAPKEDGSENLHEDIGFFSYDPDHKKIMFRQFLSEGYVNTYVLKQNEPGKLVFVSLGTEGADGTRARFTIKAGEPGHYVSSLELGRPGKELADCRSQTMRKLDPENWLSGLDVSHFSGPVDWSQVKADGHRFAFVKATEGNDWLDPTFMANMDAAREAGLIRGAYHFFVAHDDAAPQAKNFIENVQLSPGDLPPVVDIETLSNRPVEDLADRLKKWLTMVENHYGVKPIIYTSHNFWNSQLKETFGGYPLWIAEYGSDLPRLPNGWEVWSFWQYKDDATPPGVAKMADLNYFNGDHGDLKRLLIPRP